MALAKNYKPKWTMWRRETVRKIATAHKRAERRAVKQQLHTEGEEFEAPKDNRPLTQWDFD